MGLPERPRDTGLDALRGLLILAVVIGHLPPLSGTIGQQIGSLTEVLYLFHVPAFIILSAALLKPQRGFTAALKNQAHLVMAFVAWLSLSKARLVAAGDWEPFGCSLLLGNFQAIGSILWFLPALITSRLLVMVYLTSGFVVRGLLLGLSTLTIVDAVTVQGWHVSIPWGLDIALYLLPACLLGRLSYERGLEAAVPRWLAAHIGLLALGLLYLLEPYGDMHKIDLAQFDVASTPLNYLLMALACCSLICVFARSRAPALLVGLGIFSLPIYLLHARLLSVTFPLLQGLPAAAALILLLGVGLAGPVALALIASFASVRTSRAIGLLPSDPRLISLVGRSRPRLAQQFNRLVQLLLIGPRKAPAQEQD